LNKIIHQFQQITGAPPALVIRAPGRINLIGEHIDYHEGFVLPAAIDKALYFAVSPRTDSRLELYAHDLNEHYSGDIQHLIRSGMGWPDYLLGAVSELLQDGYTPGGVNLVFGGDIPAGSGLSSSAAMENGMLFALNYLFELGISKLNMIRLAQRGENNFVGMNCGIMDMFASMMGRKNEVIRIDCRSLEYAYFPFNLPDHTLVLCNSGVKHALVNSDYNTRRAEAESGLHLLKGTAYADIRSLRDLTPDMLFAERNLLTPLVFKRCKHVVEENERVLLACRALEKGDAHWLGQLLYQSHEGLQHEYEVSCPEMDFLVDETRSDDAVAGSRMMGGGFGGCTLNLVRKESVPEFLTRLEQAYFQKFRIRLASHEVRLTDGVGII